VNPLNGQVTWNLSAGSRSARAHQDRRLAAVGDIDGDGFLEIVQARTRIRCAARAATSMSRLRGGLRVVAHQRSRLRIDHEGSLSPRVATNPADLPAGCRSRCHLRRDLLPTVGHGVSQGPRSPMSNGDGKDEVMCRQQRPVYVLRGDGTSL